MKQFGTLLDQIRSINNDEVREHYAKYEVELPKDIWDLNGVGIWPGNGMSPTRENRMTGRFRDLDRIVHISRGANDGFLEYPLVALPASIAPRVNTVAFWSSHNLLDGGFGPYDLQVEGNRRLFWHALYQTILEGPDGAPAKN